MTDGNATSHRAAIHILRVPEHEHGRRPVGDKWCFRCRKRLPHDWVVYVPDDEMSYYGPRGQFECPRCGHDATRFNG